MPPRSEAGRGRTSNPQSSLSSDRVLSMHGLHQVGPVLPEGRRALTIKDFCKTYGPSRSTVYALSKAGKLKIYKIGGRSVIRVEDAEALLNGGEG